MTIPILAVQGITTTILVFFLVAPLAQLNVDHRETTFLPETTEIQSNLLATGGIKNDENRP